MNLPTSTTVLSFLTLDPFSRPSDLSLSDLYTNSLHGCSNTSVGMLERLKNYLKYSCKIHLEP